MSSGAPVPMYIAPAGSGSRDGSSWAHAADLADLPELAAAMPTGGSIVLRNDAGHSYLITRPLDVQSGGTAESPLVVTAGSPTGGRAAAVLVGDRAAPWRKGAPPGGEALRLGRGADHVLLLDLHCQDLGTCVRVRADVTDLRLERVSGDNVRRFLEDLASQDGSTATIEGLVVRQLSVTGFSKGVLRLQYDTSHVLLEDVTGDSERQDGDDFAIGVHLDDSAHDVTVRRVTMRNSQDTDGRRSTGTATDSRLSAGCTTCTSSTPSPPAAPTPATTSSRRRQRCYALWRQATSATTASGRPTARPWSTAAARSRGSGGGSGSQAQVHVTTGARVRLQGCAFVDGDAHSVVFDVEEHADITMSSGSIVRSRTSRLSVVQAGGRLVLDPRVRLSTT